MGKVSYVEKPEVLSETIHLFLNDLATHDEQFHGIFRDGKIDGIFFSTRFLDLRRRFGFLQIKGSYNLDKGVMTFRLYRTGHYYLLSVGWLIFAIVGSYQALETPFKFLFIFPILLGFSGIVFYYFVYQSRVSEFLKTFNHYLNVTKQKFDPNESSKTQNTDPKPHHSAHEE